MWERMADARAMTGVDAMQNGEPPPSSPGGLLAEARLDHGHLRILSHVDWVEPVAMFLKRQALATGLCDPDRADRLIVALTEAINNGIVHGNLALDSSLKEDGGEAFRKAIEQRSTDPAYTGRLLDIRVERHPGSCTWIVTDEGAGFDVERAMARLASDDPRVLLSSGRGISIMQAFVDEVDWSEGGRQVRLTIHTRDKADERRSERFDYTATVTIQPEGEGVHRAMARDLAREGIALVATRAFRPGLAATVVLDAELESARSASGRIVRCRHVTGPYHDVAVEFDAPIALPA